jgi:hypothetical protein
VQSQQLPGLSPSDFSVWSIDASPPGFIGGGSDGPALISTHPGIPRFHRVRIVSAHLTTYTGLAFDASTLTGIYSYGGVVVKNCICALSPVLMDDL